jgi:UDP-N-acetylglucosamine 4,6-dehydratase/5-epimerase
LNDSEKKSVSEGLQNARVLITGGTGSFGVTMMRYLAAQGAAEVRVFSRDELKQDELRRSLAGEPASFYLGDVRDSRSLDIAMREVDYVFHAAALKQVPSCEFFPEEAVKTNVMGSANVLDSALRNGVRSVVMLSTDKAVFPVNAMGMSKSLMEKLGTAFARANPSGPVVSCVRYGNVMMSRGSVIPLFIDQFRKGKPFTVTNPDMTRFLMPLVDAVDLVEHALLSAQTGDLFVQKAPASTVADLAAAVAVALGNADHPAVTIGTRHSEKLYETLASSEELGRSEDQGRYFRVRSDMRGLEYEKYFDVGNPETPVDDYTSHSTDRLSVQDAVDLLLSNAEFQKATSL